MFIMYNIELTFEDSPEPETLKICDGLSARYDCYTEAIDSLAQERKANKNNLVILEELASLGVISAIIPGFEAMSGKVYDRILLEKDKKC